MCCIVFILQMFLQAINTTSCIGTKSKNIIRLSKKVHAHTHTKGHTTRKKIQLVTLSLHCRIDFLTFFPWTCFVHFHWSFLHCAKKKSLGFKVLDFFSAATAALDESEKRNLYKTRLAGCLCGTAVNHSHFC